MEVHWMTILSYTILVILTPVSRSYTPPPGRKEGRKGGKDREEKERVTMN